MDRPILFSGPMVRAILEGRKTQTRRVLKPQPDYGASECGYSATGWGERDAMGRCLCTPVRVPYAVGDILWVREAWRTGLAYEDLPPASMSGEEQILYEEDGGVVRWWPGSSEFGRRRNSIHMPRWASRLTLTVTDVRVQRVQKINEDDAKAEGARPAFSYPGSDAVSARPRYRWGFHELWDSINASRGFGWDVNPWVAALTFDVIRANINALPTVPGTGEAA
ncbi:hypothetical protein ATO13_08676 [Stappia sp. 22II-S9-Z10]|nr:hypothetical protein ATO13_08676 [Stappia sp. 22II-S9-Z10]